MKDSSYVALGFYDCSSDLVKSILPEAGTTQSACVDVRARFHTPDITVYNLMNQKTNVTLHADSRGKICLNMLPGDRTLVPTGWRLLIPHGFQVKLVPRSGLALKHGVTLINTPATIDSDYTDELMVILHNTSGDTFMIEEGDRIAQLEMARNSMDYTMIMEIKDIELLERHKASSNRDGGFGSTGI